MKSTNDSPAMPAASSRDVLTDVILEGVHQLLAQAIEAAESKEPLSISGVGNVEGDRKHECHGIVVKIPKVDRHVRVDYSGVAAYAKSGTADASLRTDP